MLDLTRKTMSLCEGCDELNVNSGLELLRIDNSELKEDNIEEPDEITARLCSKCRKKFKKVILGPEAPRI